jgi:IclR family acetate operon transcriptional repressor
LITLIHRHDQLERRFVTDIPQATDGPQALRSVNRALDVLEALGNADKEGMAVAEVADAIGVSKSTAFVLLQTLLTRHFVADVRLGGSRRYKLGLALVPLGGHAAAGMGISQTRDGYVTSING